MRLARREYVVVQRPENSHRQLPCDECSGDTWHETLVRARCEMVAEGKREIYEHEIVFCAGCETIAFRDHWSFGATDKPAPYGLQRIYPVRQDSTTRRRLNGSGSLPARVKQIYGETFIAINAGTLLLAGIGIRALVESVCKQKRIRGKNLKDRIDGLRTAGLLGAVEAEILHRLRFLGNRAAHEMRVPTTLEINAGMDIAEHLLTTVYLLAGKAKQLPSR